MRKLLVALPMAGVQAHHFTYDQKDLTIADLGQYMVMSDDGEDFKQVLLHYTNQRKLTFELALMKKPGSQPFVIMEGDIGVNQGFVFTDDMDTEDVTLANLVAGSDKFVGKWWENIVFKQCWYPKEETTTVEKYCHNGWKFPTEEEAEDGAQPEEVKVAVRADCPWANEQDKWSNEDMSDMLVQTAYRDTEEFHKLEIGKTYKVLSYYYYGECADAKASYASGQIRTSGWKLVKLIPGIGPEEEEYALAGLATASLAILSALMF